MIAVSESDNLAATGRPGPYARALQTAARYALPLILLLALAVRVLLILRAPGVLDGDEALVGIQAEEIAAGTAHPLPVFFYGQHYMGSLEAYLAAVLFRVAGPSVVALRLIPLLFALLFVALTYVLGRRVLGRQAGLFAALLAACPPLYSGVWSIKARGGYEETLALGSALLIVTHRLLYGPYSGAGLYAVPPARRLFGRVSLGPLERGWWVLWGLLAGVLFWINPISLYYILTCSGALVLAALRRHGWRMRGHTWRAALLPCLLIGVGAALGGFPLWADNVATHGATFGYLFSGAGGSATIGRAPQVAAYFWANILPKLLGAWEPWGSAHSIISGVFVAAFYALAGVYLLIRLLAGRRGVLGYRARPQHGQGLLLAFAFCCVVVTLFCLSGFGGTALNQWGFDAASRYALPLESLIPVAAGALIWRLWRQWLPLGAGALLVLLAIHMTGYVTAQPNAVFQSEYWTKLPASEEPLADFLAQHSIRDVWMNHWAGYPLMFYADRHSVRALAAADYYDVVVGHGPNRLPWVMQRVASDPHAAYVLVTPEQNPPLARLLATRRVQYDQARIGPYLVFWDLRPFVPPSAVVDALGFAY